MLRRLVDRFKRKPLPPDPPRVFGGGAFKQHLGRWPNNGR